MAFDSSALPSSTTMISKPPPRSWESSASSTPVSHGAPFRTGTSTVTPSVREDVGVDSIELLRDARSTEAHAHLVRRRARGRTPRVWLLQYAADRLRESGD